MVPLLSKVFDFATWADDFSSVRYTIFIFVQLIVVASLYNQTLYPWHTVSKTICPIIHTTPTKSCFNEMLKFITIKCFLNALMKKCFKCKADITHIYYVFIISYKYHFLLFSLKTVVILLHFKFNFISLNRLALTNNLFFWSAWYHSQGLFSSLYNAFTIISHYSKGSKSYFWHSLTVFDRSFISTVVSC